MVKYASNAEHIQLGSRIKFASNDKETGVYTVVGRNKEEGKIYIIDLQKPERGILYIPNSTLVTVESIKGVYKKIMFTSLSALNPGNYFQVMDGKDFSVYKIDKRTAAPAKNGLYSYGNDNYTTYCGKHFKGDVRVRILDMEASPKLCLYSELQHSDMFIVRDSKIHDNYQVFRVKRTHWQIESNSYKCFSVKLNLTTHEPEDSKEYLFEPDTVIQLLPYTSPAKTTKTYPVATTYYNTSEADREVEDIVCKLMPNKKVPKIEEGASCAC
jgi:hypothetical protein